MVLSGDATLLLQGVRKVSARVRDEDALLVTVSEDQDDAPMTSHPGAAGNM